MSTSLVSASVVATGQVQSVDSVRAHALPSDALIFTSATKVQPANQNLGSYSLIESANALTLTTTGSVPVVTQSPFADLYKEGSVYFNGTTGNYISSVATGLSGTQWKTTGLTVEAWVNYQTFTGAASQSASSNQPNLLGFGGFSWQFGSNISGNSTFQYWTNVTTPVTYMATTSVSTNTWNHIAFTCTSSGTGYMFVNGVQSQILTNTNGAISGPASTVSITGTPVLSGSTLYLNQNIGGTAGVSGYVADVRVITGAALYTSTFTIPSAPLSTSATGVTQVLIRAGQNAPTIQNGALTFDRGLKQYMNFGPQTFNIVTQGFTAVWRGAFTGTPGNYETIFEGGLYGTSNGGIFVGRAGTSTGLYFQISASTGTSAVFTVPVASILSEGVQTVIAARYNPATSLADVWVNGVFQASATCSPAALVGDRLLATSYVGYPYATNSFTSMTSNTLAVYNRALSNVEIYNSYLALSTAPQQALNTTVEFGDVNGTPALSIAGDGRVAMTNIGQTSNVLPWPPAAMTGYVTSINGGIYRASASTEYNPGGGNFYYAWYAFDKSTSTNPFASGTTYNTSIPYNYTGTVTTTDVNGTVYPGEWLQIQQPSSVTLLTYSITPSTTAATTQSPSKWVVLGSRDGVNWFLVDSRSGVTSWANGVTQTFSGVSSTQTFAYFRFVVSNSLGSTLYAITEWTLYGTADTAQTLTVAQPMTLSYGAQTASLTGISGDRYVPQDFSSSGLNIPAYVVSNTATTANTVQYSSFGPFAGEGSLYFPGGTGSYMNFGTQLPVWTGGSQDATFEAWVYLPAYQSDNGIIFMRNASLTSSSYDWAFYINLAGTLTLNIGASTSGGAGSASTVPLNQWVHVAGTIQSGTVRAFINGTLGGTTNVISGTVNYHSNYLTMMGNWKNITGDMFNGYIACARIVSGTALYTTSFTPPTGPLQPIQGVTQAGTPYGTVLLLRNAPAPGRVLTQKFGGTNSGSVLAFPPAAMTTYATTLNSGYGQGTYVASESSNNGYPSWQLFDKNTSTFWQVASSYTANVPYSGTIRTVDISGNSYAGEWAQIQFPSSIILSNYSIYEGGGAMPTAWYILGSRDGINWYLIDQRNTSVWTGYTTFNVSGSQAYTYYRFVYNTSSGTSASLYEIIYNGTIEGPNVTADGRLGVGVSVPTRALEVAGDVVCGGTVSSGTGLMFRNALYNGDMRIAQRGTSFTFASTSQYTLDRWYVDQYGAAGNGTVSQIQSGLQNFANALQLASTSTVLGNWYISQSLETRDVVRFQGQPVTFSFWFRTPTPFTQSWQVYVSYSTVTDQKLPDFGTQGTTIISIFPSFGTTNWTYFQGTGFLPLNATSLAVQFFNYNNVVNGAQVQITGVQLEKGTVATPFEVRPYGVELQLCQRYYQEMPNTNGVHFTGGARLFGVTNATAGTNILSSLYLTTPMRSAPTPTYYGGGSSTGTYNINTSSSGSSVSTSVSAASTGTSQTAGNMISPNLPPITATGGSAQWIDMGWGSTNFGITLNSEL